MKNSSYPSPLRLLLMAALIALLSGCSDDKDKPPFYTDAYVVFAWNDLGMHCLNPTYDKAVILPPYNTVLAQVVKRGDPPQLITSGLTVEYRILDNTTSYGKREYGGFWDNITALFGLPSLEHDRGLTGNKLTGIMAVSGERYEATGIPVTPVSDQGVWEPLQVAEITVKDASGKTLASTRATVPTSDEINCAKCHGTDPFNDVLAEHDDENGTTLMQSKPVLCANCHGSMALGKSGRGTSGKYLSEAIHGFHADKDASCYDCHPGQTTQCNRSAEHTGAEGNCTECHGTMAQVASSTQTGRIPWLNEPACVTCHSETTDVGTTTTLYRESTGHGEMMCSACHGSPHAMVPSLEDADNYQAMQYQPYSNSPKTLASCGACHDNSRGEEDEISEFVEKHGGADPEKITGCYICHTAVYDERSQWPHAYTWKNSNR